MTAGPGKLPPIRFEALAAALASRIEQLVPMWLPGGRMRGNEYFVHSFWRSEKTPSLSVCMKGSKAGHWADHGGEHRGRDLISLYAALHGLDNGQAAVQVARELGLEDVAGVTRDAAHQAAPRIAPPPPDPTPSRPAHDEGWSTLRPVPASAPSVNFKHPHREEADIELVSEYRHGADLLGYVVRFRTSAGGKDPTPRTWCVSARDGAARWCWRQFDEPRPLYVPGFALPATGQTVVVVEGEKKAKVLQDLLDAGSPGVYVVVSWPGGSKVWQKADWSPLAGLTVLLWPDCDGKRELLTTAERKACGDDELARQVLQAAKPLLPADKQVGMKAMLGIGVQLLVHLGCRVQMLPIPMPGEVVDGWDCADAILHDGWDHERVLAFFAQAFDLPVAGSSGEPVADAGAGGGGFGEPPATGAHAGAGDGGDAGEGGSVRVGARDIPRWLLPYWDADKSRWLVSRKLVIAALEHDPLLADVLGRNELSNNIEARQAWPWAHGRAGPITGSTDLALGDYLTRTYGLPSIARAALTEAIETVAHARPFHPLRDYLQGLQHDGTARLDRWLLHVIGETPDTVSPALREYLTLAGRFWILGMVARVMEPGCKFDYCPVLEGPGGLMKSSMVEALASPAYFSDAHFDLTRGKEGQEQVQGLWLYELAELSSFGKAEIQLIKAFISSKVDRYRPSYGRTVEAFARQCVLVGTTNEKTYLRDRTGNRRFWPIPVRHRIRIDWLKRVREQLLAEAYVLYQAGERFNPSPEEELRLFVPMQESRLVETAVLSELTYILSRDPTPDKWGQVVNNLADFVTISHLTQAMGVDAAKSSPALEAQIRSWMDHEGWERVKKQLNGVRAWGYARPVGWPKSDEMPPPDAPGAAVASSGGADDDPF